jgi:hypothetical protein
VKIVITRVQRHMLMARVSRRLKGQRKTDDKQTRDEVDRLQAIWENMLGWGMSDRIIDLRKLNDLEIILLEEEIDEFILRTSGNRRIRTTRRSLDKKLHVITEFRKRSAVDRLAELT